MKKYLLRLNDTLFNRVNLLAKDYNVSINKMFIKLIEIGYLKFIGEEYGEKENLYWFWNKGIKKM